MRVGFTLWMTVILLAPVSFGLLRAQNTDSEKGRFEEALQYFKKHRLVPIVEHIKINGQLGHPKSEQKGETSYLLDLIIQAKGESYILKNCQVTDHFSCGQIALMCLGGEGHYSQTLENWSYDKSPFLIYTYDRSKAGQCQGIKGAF